MNEFTNKHPRDRRRQSASLDGLSRPRQRSESSGGSIDFKRPQSYQPSEPKAIDDFARPDGFKPNTANRSLNTMQAADEPILIPKHPPKKRGLLRRKSRASSSLDGMGRRKRISKRKKVLRSAGIFAVILVAMVGFLFAKGYLNLRKVLSGTGGAAALQENVDPSRLRGEGDGRINILVLGRGGEGHEGADLTDTLILASIDPIAKDAALVSIPRDLYVAVPGDGSMKVNAVFSTGKSLALQKSTKQKPVSNKEAEDAGFSLLEKTVETTLGVPIHYHAMVDFNGFKQAVDTVGGIDLNVPGAVREQMRIDGKTYILDVKPGQQHMDGFKALAYSRSRYTSARGDFDRSERQRLIIVALKEKIFSIGTFSNPVKISQLLDNFGNHVQTNFSSQDLSRLYDISKDINGSKISSIGLADPPNNFLTTSNVGGLSVVVPRAGVNNYKEVQSFIRNALKDSFIRNENASVLILNGTTVAGQASAKAEELKSYGYNVTDIANAPTKNYTKSVIVDLRNGQKKYTKSYLEKRFGVSAVNSLPDATIQPGTADFVIIIGSDNAR